MEQHRHIQPMIHKYDEHVLIQALSIVIVCSYFSSRFFSFFYVDDRQVAVWSSAGQLKVTHETGHFHNIFSALFVPHTDSSQLVTSAGDGCIRHVDLNTEKHSQGRVLCDASGVIIRLEETDRQTDRLTD